MTCCCDEAAAGLESPRKKSPQMDGWKMPAFWLSRLSSSSRLEICCGDDCPHCNLVCRRCSSHLHETLGHRLMSGGGDAAAAPIWTWQLLLLLH